MKILGLDNKRKKGKYVYIDKKRMGHNNNIFIINRYNFF